MANFLDTLQGLGESVLEYGDAFLDSATNSTRSNDEANKALAERLKINNAIALQNAQQKGEQAKENQILMKNIVYILMGIVFVLACVYAVKMFKK